MQWIPSEKKEQSDALFDGQVTDVYLIDGHALPPSAIHDALAQPKPKQEPVAWLTKELMANYLDTIAEAIDANRSEMLRHKAHKLRDRGEV